jgi:hypothetical protein
MQEPLKAVPERARYDNEENLGIPQAPGVNPGV